MKDIFVSKIKEENLHPLFKILRDHKPMEPAKLMIEEITSEMEEQDGNFIQQFQTTGFLPRIWEIYLFKFLQENGFNFIEEKNRPDFHIEKNGKEFFIEASLSNEVEDDKFSRKDIEKAIKNKDEKIEKDLIDHYIIRMGSVLYSKLCKKYWELDWVQGKPLVLAITPAHNYLANFLPDAKIIEYLYGLSHKGELNENGELVLKSIEKVDSHSFGKKEIPSNFFSLPDTENISAVIFTNNSDLHKFNRMGYQSGLSDKCIIMERAGLAFDWTPNSPGKEFGQSIKPGVIKENWNESVTIFHNPNALNPLDMDLFENIRQVYINEEGKFDGPMPEFFVFHSKTLPVLVE